LQRSHKFCLFNNSNHLKDLVICILWTLVMSFSDTQAMILTVILTVKQTHDFKTPSDDYDKWQVFGENKLKNNFCTHCVPCVDCVLSFHSCNAFVFGVQASQRSPMRPSKTIQLTNNGPAITTSSFLQLPNHSAPIPHDSPASFMSIFLSQLMVEPTSNFLHFHVPMNATNTAAGLRIHYDSHQTSLNDVTIAHVSATTATMTATMRNVFTTRNATTKALQYQLAQA
jgi:hypothetical protein